MQHTPSSSAAVLLLHGFGGHPFEMRSLQKALEAAGYYVEVPLLPGHGVTVDEFQRTDFVDWYGTAREAFLRLSAAYEQVFVAGLSLGGALSLALGEEFDPAGIATLAAPVFLYSFFPPLFSDWRLPFVPLLQHVRPIWPMPGPSSSSREIAPWRGYECVMALKPLTSLLRGIKIIREDLRAIKSPLLSIHAKGDRTVPVQNVWEIQRSVSSQVRRLELLSIQENITSHHLLTTHRDTRERVAFSVVHFFDELRQ